MQSARKLKKASQEFERREGRASFYDLAVEVVDRFPLQAAVVLLATWNMGRFRYFASDNENLAGLANALKQTAPLFTELRHERFETADFEKISNVVAAIYNSFSRVKGVEYTGASKLMHLLNRNLFVMWDSYIRKELGFKNWDALDYLAFLKAMQGKFGNVRWNDKNKTLTKAIDEYNYVNISMPAMNKKGIKKTVAR